MEYSHWAPVYERIRADLGFSWERELASARRLAEWLPAGSASEALARLRHRLADRDVVVVGLAPRAGAPPVWRLPPGDRPAGLVAADGAAARCLDAALVPDVVVTDLDGPVPSEITAQSRGALVVVHAHGDNRPALDRWLPEFRRDSTMGTWSGPPDPPLLDFGGFTDGDRAAYLAEAAGARRVLLWGFDFGSVDDAEPDPVRKRRKLRWAQVALDHLAVRSAGRIHL